METIADLKRYLVKYDTGRHTATELRQALLKRLSGVDGALPLPEVKVPADVMKTRDNVDAAVSLFRYLGVPWADDFYRAALAINWNECAIRLEGIKHE